MSDASALPPTVQAEPDIDADGVDLAQVRAMLDLAPAERLSRVTEFTISLLAIRARNGTSRSD
jgi:hypothetical protein